MDIFEYWPIILGVIFYLIRAAKGSEKEDNQSRKRSKQRSAKTVNDYLESFIDEISGNEQTEAPVYHSEEYNIENDKVEVKKPNVPLKTQQTKEPIKRIEIEELDQKIDFDVKQAIINDAILNRPFAD